LSSSLSSSLSSTSVTHFVEKDFDSVWFQYPVKDGKKEALRHFKASVKTPEDLKDINTALAKYKAHVEEVRKNGHPERRYKNGATWFNNWRDWTNFEGDQEETWADSYRRRKEAGKL
jgi:hypothetical protein